MITRAIFGVIAGTLALLLFSTSYAGGESWKFTITALTSDDGDEYVVELRPVDRSSGFPSSCATLTVVGEYASLFWFFKFGSGPGKEEHKAALAMMREAYKSKAPIKFGWIGDGVNFTSRTGACAATSRGLMADRASDAVYSYFKWP